jgi:hypothetical protein
MKSPYDKGPLQRREVPGMVLGTGILVLGMWGLTRYMVARAKRTQASALVVNRGDRFR